MRLGGGVAGGNKGMGSSVLQSFISRGKLRLITLMLLLLGIWPQTAC